MLVGVMFELTCLWPMNMYMQDNQIMKNVAAALEKEGISAFRFDFSGNGFV